VRSKLGGVDEEKPDAHKADGVSDGVDGVDGKKQDGIRTEGASDNFYGVDGIKTDGTANSSHSHMSSTSSLAITISNKTDVHVILGSSAAHSSNSGTVSNISSSVIDMSQLTVAGKPLAGLHLKNIKDSLVICGQVSGSVHITDVQNSVLVTACRQFRMHGSKNTQVYLHCASRPIIEDCEEIEFAPLPDVYVGLLLPIWS
jgi:tubulin-specific chaperone C